MQPGLPPEPQHAAAQPEPTATQPGGHTLGNAAETAQQVGWAECRSVCVCVCSSLCAFMCWLLLSFVSTLLPYIDVPAKNPAVYVGSVSPPTQLKHRSSSSWKTFLCLVSLQHRLSLCWSLARKLAAPPADCSEF